VRASRLSLLLLTLLGCLLSGTGAANAARIEGPPAAVREGEVAEFRVVREAGDPAPLRFELAGDTAGADEVLALSRPIEVWGAEEVIRVQALPDQDHTEPDERFVLRTTDGAASASATITEPRRCPRGPRLARLGGGEGQGEVRMTVTVCNLGPTPEHVQFRTTGLDGAQPGDDFEARSGELVFGPGTSTQEIVVPVVDDDEFEMMERLVIELGTRDGGWSGPWVYIDDDVPAVRVEPLTVPEGDGPGVARLPVRSIAGHPDRLPVVLRVARALAPGAATPGAEFAEGRHVVWLGAGPAAAEVELPVTGDTLDEPDEHFLVFPQWYRQGEFAVPITIADDDGPRVSVAAPRLDAAGAVSVGVACASAVGACEGSARVALVGAAAAAAAAPGPARSFRAPDARRRPLRLRLPGPARTRLRSGRSVRVRATVRARGADDDVSVVTRTVRLTPRR
jgi:hypothetical protein